jgi:hypothetical protein
LLCFLRPTTPGFSKTCSSFSEEVSFLPTQLTKTKKKRPRPTRTKLLLRRERSPMAWPRSRSDGQPRRCWRCRR